MAVSPDGKTVYGLDTADNTLVVAAAGSLTELQSFKQGLDPLGQDYGLQGATSVTVSANGQFVYVAGEGKSKIGIFATQTRAT